MRRYCVLSFYLFILGSQITFAWRPVSHNGRSYRFNIFHMFFVADTNVNQSQHSSMP